MNAMRESKIERYLKERVEAKGGVCYKWSAPGRRGAPDRIVVLDGTTVFVELKTKAGILSPHQLKMHEELENAGGIVLTCRSIADVDCLVAALVPIPDMKITWQR